MASPEAALVAKAFHYHYERLAPMFGYETRPESRDKRFHELPEPQRAVMLATAEAVLLDLPRLFAAKLAEERST